MLWASSQKLYSKYTPTFSVSPAKVFVHCPQVWTPRCLARGGRSPSRFSRISYLPSFFLFRKDLLYAQPLKNFSYCITRTSACQVRTKKTLQKNSPFRLISFQVCTIIVKKNKTTHTGLSAIITYSPFCLILIPPYIFRNRGLEKIEKFSEKHYNDYKIHNINKH